LGGSAYAGCAYQPAYALLGSQSSPLEPGRRSYCMGPVAELPVSAEIFWEPPDGSHHQVPAPRGGHLPQGATWVSEVCGRACADSCYRLTAADGPAGLPGASASTWSSRGREATSAAWPRDGPAASDGHNVSRPQPASPFWLARPCTSGLLMPEWQLLEKKVRRDAAGDGRLPPRDLSWSPARPGPL
jgi:hypothetical protein